MGISLEWKKKLFPIVLVSNLEKLIAMLSRTSSNVFGVLIYLYIKVCAILYNMQNLLTVLVWGVFPSNVCKE